MLRIRYLLISLVVCASPTLGAEQDLEDSVRVQYNGSPDLPDGVAFHEILRFTNSLLPGERHVAVALIQGEMGLSDESAESLLTKMSETFGRLKADVDANHRLLGCNGRVASVAGDAVYSTFEAMDDKTDEVADQHLRDFLRSLDPDTAKRFQQWIGMEKLSIVHIKFDHAKAYAATGDNGEDVLAQMCDRLA